MFQFFKNLGAEWGHIVWPSRSTTALWTIAVVIVSLIIAYYLGALDYLFSKLLLEIISFFQN